jgi:hypothetical protein
VTELDSTLPPDLDTLVSKALNKNRDERYQTADQLLADLKVLKKSVESSQEQMLTAPQQPAVLGLDC